MGWLPDFELDEEDVLDPNIWEAASYDELTYFGIEDFRHNDWEWEVWLNELTKRFSKMKEKHPTQQYSSVNTKFRLKVADRLLEVLYDRELDEHFRLEIALFEFDPHRSLGDLFSFPPSSNEEFWDDMVTWAEEMVDYDGLIGIYSEYLLLIHENNRREAVDFPIDMINESENRYEVNMLMSMLCHNVAFFASEWGKTGVDPYNGDTIENIQRIVNTDIEYIL